MLPRAAPPELAALSIGPVAAYLVVTSVFAPYAPNGNLRWGFWVLAFVYAAASVFPLRARTVKAAFWRSLTFALFFAVSGCLFVWFSDAASRIDHVRVYGLEGHLFTGACIVVVTTLLMLGVAFPILRVQNRRALDHGEGFVSAYGTLVMVFAAVAVQNHCLGNRRADAAVAVLAFPALSLVLLLAFRARRYAFWRRAMRGDEGFVVEEAKPADTTPLLFQGIPGERNIVHAAQLGYREGGMRVPLARVPASIGAGALASALPAIPIVLGLVAFSYALHGEQTFGLPSAVASYGGGHTEVYRSWEDFPPGWKSWHVQLVRGSAMRDDDETVVAIDPNGRFLEGKALVVALAATYVTEATLASVSLFALRHHYVGYIPNAPPCARAKDARVEHREGNTLSMCGAWRAPREGAPLGLHVERLNVDLSTGEMTTVEATWMKDDGSLY